MKRFLFSGIAAAILVSSAFAAGPTGIANVIGAKSWESQQTPPYGMYSFSMDVNPDVKLVSDKVVPGNFGAVYVDGRYFVIEGIATSASSFITNYIYDAETWSKITDFRGENSTAFDMAWDETTGNVYGYFHNFDTNAEFFGTIDINTGKTTRISSLPFVAYGLACDVDGRLYAIDKEGKLYSINKTTGSSTPIGSSGCSSKWTTSGAIDSSTRTFYYACCNDSETILYGINLDTAVATRIAEIPDNMEMIGLYFPEPSALPKAPKIAENLSFDFTGAALSGNFLFTIPSTLNDGSAASGEVDYTAIINGETLKTGKAQYGTTVSLPLTRQEAGECEATVLLKNTVGSAPTARFKAWIGQDVPAPVGKIEIVYDGNGSFSISWPEARALHGGWFDPSTVTYNVVRYSSESTTPTRFDGQTTNSFTDKVSLPYEDEYATYHYDVAAVFGTEVSSYTSSEFYTIGSRTPPFTEQFNARYELGKFTILEGEKKDYERWNYSSTDKAATVSTNTSIGADDYLLLPPLTLENGMEYEISFDVKGKYSSDTERFEVLAGQSPTVDALTEKILTPTEFKGTAYSNYKMQFAPNASGTYFIAIHAMSDPNKGAITVDNIKVGGGVQTGVDQIETEAEGNPVYFTLQGIRIDRPASGSICIERRGSKVRKVIIH